MAEYPVQLQKNEEVVRLLRRHPARIVAEILGLAIGALLLVLVLDWVGGVINFLSGLTYIANIIIVVGAVLFALFEIYRYFNDIWLITNQRIVDSTKKHIFNHTVSSADLVNLQDINIVKKGVFATVFNYGDVRCQTASMTQVFTFRGVPNPTEVLELLDNLRDQARSRRGG